MSHRHAISDADWARIAHLLPCQPGTPGPVSGDNRLFVAAVLWIAKTGVPWRDLPERFGKWNSVYQRFNRWCRSGVWLQVLAALADPDVEWLILDSTVIRAHQHAAGAPKNCTAPAVRRTKHWDTVEAGSGPRFTGRSAGWACRWNCT